MRKYTLEEVEASPLADSANARRLRGARRLPRVMLGAQARHELCRVECPVHTQLFGDCEQSARELGDRELLARRLYVQQVNENVLLQSTVQCTVQCTVSQSELYWTRAQ